MTSVVSSVREERRVQLLGTLVDAIDLEADLKSFEIEMNFSNGSIEFSVNGKLHRGTYLTVTQIVPYLKRIKSL